MNEQILKLGEQAELRCRERFREIDRAAEKNTERVLTDMMTSAEKPWTAFLPS